MKILFHTSSNSQVIITAYNPDQEIYEVHLYITRTGYDELHNTATNLPDAIEAHRLLAEKCGIPTNM
jgi:hypothetical protein